MTSLLSKSPFRNSKSSGEARQKAKAEKRADGAETGDAPDSDTQDKGNQSAMTPPLNTGLTTEDFPYTISYVMELLRLDERELMSYVQMLGLSNRKDDKTGRQIFTHRDIETLKKAMDMKKHGEDMGVIVQQLGNAQAVTSAPATPGRPAEASAAAAETMQPMTTQNAMQTRATGAGGKDNITVMVEAVSQVKEGILKDLSRLLDDKLSGLDEVVVELIRCKSENDSLRKKLNDVTRTKEHLEYEISRFKPVQFGFYRKQ